jgi:hypothetical protein
MNHYNIKDIKIEFTKSYKKEYTNFSTTNKYDFSPIYPNECLKYVKTNIPCGIYLPVEFTKRNLLGYIKMKNNDIWLYDDKFDNLTIDDLTGYNKQPLVCWFEYIDNNKFLVYKYKNYGEIYYLQYNDKNNSIIWSNSKQLATIFTFYVINWNDLSWINYEKNKIFYQ